jgi:hypothetical protein
VAEARNEEEAPPSWRTPFPSIVTGEIGDNVASRF